MKSAFVKRVIAAMLVAIMLAGDVTPVLAQGTGDKIETETVETIEEEESSEESGEEESSEEESGEEESSEEESSEEESSEEESSEEGTSEEESSEEGTSEEESSEEESVEETITEETTEEVVEDKIPEDELSVSVNEIPEEEVPLADALPVSLEPVTVNGITITVSGPASAFAEGTTVSAVEVDPVEIKEEVIDAVEEIEQATIKRYKAFDINLVYDGEFVQPLNDEEITVNFEGDLLIPDTDKEEEVVVYHVDEENDIEKMEAEVTPIETEGATDVDTVEMTTTHFSTYVVMITGEDGSVNFTINHYSNDGWDDYSNNKANFDKEKYYLFESDTGTVDRGGRIHNFVKGKNKLGETDFQVAHIDVVGGETDSIDEEADEYEYTITPDTDKDLVINVFYSAVTGDPFENGIDMYDYNGDKKYDDSSSINYYMNYKDYKKDSNKDKQFHDNRFATRGSGYVTEKNGININAYNSAAPRQIITGLLTNLTGDNYETVNFKYDDPGFFTPTMLTADGRNIAGKTIYNNYSMVFSKKGNNYTLNEIKSNNKTVIVKDNKIWKTSKGELTAKNYPENKGRGGFWPLQNGTDKNEYFGIRHDFKFVIGDYVGNMKYKFSGDDDLWVCLNGQVILDLGGIHDAVSGEVDIWAKLIGTEDYTYQDKVNYLNSYTSPYSNDTKRLNRDKEMCVTVLYMERGGNLSNCEMEFVMPNVKASEPHTENVPKANLEITKKVEGKKQVIGGVEFTLYNDEECTDVATLPVKTGNDGKAVFENLTEKTYYLKETVAAEGYIKKEDVYVVKVERIGTSDKAQIRINNDLLNNDSGDEKTYLYVVENAPITPITIEFYKEALYTEDVISGVKFKLYEGSGEVADKFIGENITDENGYVKFEEISVGEYYLVEELTEEQAKVYKEPEKGWKIRVYLPEGQTTLIYEITDGPTDRAVDLWEEVEGKDGCILLNEPYVSFEFTKIDSHTGMPLNGAEFDLYNYSENQRGDKINASTVSSKTVEDKDGVVKFDGLTVGQQYLLFETKAVDGYKKPDTPWIVKIVYDPEKEDFVQYIYETVKGTGKNTWIESSKTDEGNIIKNTPAIGKLKITKKITEEVKSVHGTAAFVFRITCKDGTILYRTISFREGDALEDSVIISNLPEGDYIVEELDALRYACSSEDKVIQKDKVKAGETTNFIFENKKVFKYFCSHTDVVVNKVTFTRNADGEVINVELSNTDITSDSDN